MFTVEELAVPSPSSPPLPPSAVPLIEADSDGEIKGSARFAHSKSYLEHLARFGGFELLDGRSFVLRTEGTLPIPGVALLLAKV